MGEGGPQKISPLHTPYSRLSALNGHPALRGLRDMKEKQTKARRKDLPPIKVYVQPEEAEKIATLAAEAGLPVSVYLRQVGLGTPPETSLGDCERVRELVRICADLNRIGGLLKALLSNDERFSGAYGLVLKRTTMKVLEDLGETSTILKETCAQVLGIEFPLRGGVSCRVLPFMP